MSAAVEVDDFRIVLARFGSADWDLQHRDLIVCDADRCTRGVLIPADPNRTGPTAEMLALGWTRTPTPVSRPGRKGRGTRFGAGQYWCGQHRPRPDPQPCGH